jgi:anthranilate phosphoribosyltransferase
LWGTTTAFEVAGTQVIEHLWTAATFGLPECRVEELRIDSPVESAAVIREAFGGRPGPARNIVVANAAAGLLAAQKTADPKNAVEMAAQAIDSGEVLALLDRLGRMTREFVV